MLETAVVPEVAAGSGARMVILPCGVTLAT
jgi:hypothetical protein